MLQTGESAPDFELLSHNGEKVRLSSFRGNSNVILFFYPSDGTPGCTKEACAFRDEYQVFRDAGTEVIGINPGSPGSHANWAEKHAMPFLLLSDPGEVVAKKFGVSKTLGLIPRRVTFLIDKDGVIRHTISKQFQFTEHVSETLTALKKLD